jgi:hypothetical protein
MTENSAFAVSRECVKAQRPLGDLADLAVFSGSS